jgi:hypothetical protein
MDSAPKKQRDWEWLAIAVPAVISVYYLGMQALLFWGIAIALMLGYHWGWKARDKGPR